MTQLAFDSALPADSVADELRTVHNTPCKCGGRFAVKSQQLLRDEKTQKHYDLLNTQCMRCGEQKEFLFDINSFFGRRGGQIEITPREGPTRGSQIFALTACIIFFVIAAAFAGPLRSYADEKTQRASYVMMAMCVVGAILVYRNLKPAGDAGPAERQANREADGTLDEMESALAKHGVKLNWSVSTAQNALLGGIVKAGLFQGIKKLEANDLDGAESSFTRIIALIEKAPTPQFPEVLAAAYCLRATTHEHKQKKAAANDDYKAALKIDPAHAQALEGIKRTV